MVNKKKDGCCNCKHDWFGICEIYGEPNESDLIGISCCDYDEWELEE